MNKYIFSFIILITFSNFQVLVAQSDEYTSSIQSAEAYFNKGDYLNAKASFQYALRFKPDDAYAKKKIEECIVKLKDQSPVRLKYSQYIQLAEKQLKQKEYNRALQNYKQASILFKYEEYPKKQIKYIEDLILDKKDLEDDYKQSIQLADQYFKEKKYSKAKLEYQYALGLNSNSLYSKQRLKEIELVFKGMQEKIDIYDAAIKKANLLFNEGSWEQSLKSYEYASRLFPDKTYPKKKINEILPLIAELKKYNDIILKADEYYSVKDYQNAKVAYQQAINLKPQDEYPKEMLHKVLVAIQTKATNDLQDYDNAVKLGNLHIKNKEWFKAKSQFEFAGRIKPDEKYPQTKLKEINVFIKEEEADLAKQKKYESLISDADLHFSTKEYDKAIDLYQQAELLQGNDNYASTKIDEINEIKIELAKEEERRAKYNILIRKADSLYNKSIYVKAKISYEEALAIYDEAYPKEQIKDIDLKLEELAAIQSKEDNYNNAIQLADSYFNKKEYYKAKEQFKLALQFKENEKYPKDKLIEIKNILDEIARQKQLAFENKINNADSLVNSKDFKGALIALKEAQKLKPEADGLSERIAQTEKTIEENYLKAKAAYDKKIQEADRYFKAKSYDKALKAYQEAILILPEESYALSQAKKITDLFEASTTAIISNKACIIKENEIKKFEFSPINIKERKSNYFYLLIGKSEEKNNLRLLLNYGKDSSKNGGVIIRLNEANHSGIHLVRVGTQYKWFSEDNNWLSLQAEGGNIRIELIKISRGINLKN